MSWSSSSSARPWMSVSSPMSCQPLPTPSLLASELYAVGSLVGIGPNPYVGTTGSCVAGAASSPLSMASIWSCTCGSTEASRRLGCGLGSGFTAGLLVVCAAGEGAEGTEEAPQDQ